MTALPEVLEKLERAAPGEWSVRNGRETGNRRLRVAAGAIGIGTINSSIYDIANAQAIAAAVNFLREHGPALLRDAGDGAAALGLLSRMRFACGDNGLRMQDELEEYLRELAGDAARYRWLRAEHAVNSPLAHVCWKQNGDRECGEWVNTAGPDALDAAIDAAMHAPGGTTDPTRSE